MLTTFPCGPLGMRRELYLNRARRALLTHLLEHGTATADDVRKAVTLPADINPNLFGAVPGLLARENIIRIDSLCFSARPERHAGLNRVWKLANRDAALAWLRENPDVSDERFQEVFGDWPMFP